MVFGRQAGQGFLCLLLFSTVYFGVQAYIWTKAGAHADGEVLLLGDGFLFLIPRSFFALSLTAFVFARLGDWEGVWRASLREFWDRGNTSLEEGDRDGGWPREEAHAAKTRR